MRFETKAADEYACLRGMEMPSVTACRAAAALRRATPIITLDQRQSRASRTEDQHKEVLAMTTTCDCVVAGSTPTRSACLRPSLGAAPYAVPSAAMPPRIG